MYQGRIANSKVPIYGYLGAMLVLIFWYINWNGLDLRTHWAFFPLWFGYLLTADAIAVYRGRKSLIIGNWLRFGALFLISIPFWWFFEWLNTRAGYWVYLPENAFSPFMHTLWSTLCFSTVVPAIIITTNVLLTFKWFLKHHIHWRAGVTKFGRLSYFGTGLLLLIALLIWPQYGMAFMWISLFFILSPVNYALNRPSLLRYTAQGDWRMVIVLFVAALICGVFWEMWNIHSWPKWIYIFPYLNNWKVFEMPLAGYLGYLPFGLEVWAVTALVYPKMTRDIMSALPNA